MPHLGTGGCAQSCRSCTHWVADDDTTPQGWCMIHEDVMPITGGCGDHDGLQQCGDLEGMVLIERVCLGCGHVNLYTAWSPGQEWCALCD